MTNNEGVTTNEFVTPEMYGAIGDGITDDTAAFAEALQQGKVHLLSDNYLLCGLVINNDVEIVGNGARLLFNGTTFIDSENADNSITNLSGIIGVGSYNVKISDLSLKQNARIVNAMVFNGLSELEIKNCNIDGEAFNYGDFSEDGMGNGIRIKNTSNFIVENNTLKGFIGWGVDVEGSNFGIISHNDISWCGRAGIDIRCDNNNVTVSNNKILHTVKHFTVADGALDLYGPCNNDIKILNNYIEGFGGTTQACGARINGSKNVEFSKNVVVVTADSVSYTGISVQDRRRAANNSEDIVIPSNNITINNNEFRVKPGANTHTLVRLQDSECGKNVNIIGNSFMVESQEDEEENLASGSVSYAIISSRYTIEDLKIVGNEVDYKTNPCVAVYLQIEAESENSKNVIISDNIFHADYLYFCNVDNLILNNNVIESVKDKSAAVVMNGACGAVISGNYIYCPSRIANNFYSTTDCDKVLFVSNVFTNNDGINAQSEPVIIVKTE